MPRILVVEDDAEKLRRVLNALNEMPECIPSKIQNVRDAVAAKQLMRSNHYDLLILDLALPERPETIPSRDGGIALLDEVLDRDLYQKPSHIVGLTAFQDMLEEAGPRFAEDLWLVILYDPTSNTWADQLQKKIRHITLSERSGSGPPEYGTQLCIVTALYDPELKAVLSLPWQWEKFEHPNDPTVYRKGHFLKGGDSFQVIAASAPRMGMTAAGVLSMKMITSFRPKYIAMPGILAGVRGSCEIGDIVVTDPGWDYGSGKIQQKEGDNVFHPAPYQVGLNSFIRGKLTQMAQDRQALDEICNEWPGPAPKSPLRMHIGPVASGASVVADPSFLEAVKKQHRKLIAIEMETYGVLAAAEESPLPVPKAFSIKSVCDFADDHKNDDYQHYAAFTSARALKVFVEKYL